jgi:hypothetical protein
MRMVAGRAGAAVWDPLKRPSSSPGVRCAAAVLFVAGVTGLALRVGGGGPNVSPPTTTWIPKQLVQPASPPALAIRASGESAVAGSLATTPAGTVPASRSTASVTSTTALLSRGLVRSSAPASVKPQLNSDHVLSTTRAASAVLPAAPAVPSSTASPPPAAAPAADHGDGSGPGGGDVTPSASHGSGESGPGGDPGGEDGGHADQGDQGDQGDHGGPGED